MDEITRVIKDLFWLLQNMNIAEEDYKVGIGIEERIEGALRRDRVYDSCGGWCFATGILCNSRWTGDSVLQLQHAAPGRSWAQVLGVALGVGAIA